jgi:hypothetical protein
VKVIGQTAEESRLNIRLPTKVRDRLWKQSIANKRSMNAELLVILEAALK